MKALKVGLLVSSTFSDKYVYDLALWARDREDIEISHLIVHPRSRGSKLGKLTTVTIELTEGVLQDSGSVITNGLRRVSLFNASPKNSTPETYWLEVRM